MDSQELTYHRRVERISFKEPIQFRCHGSSVYGGSLSYDISEDGIRIQFNEFFPLNTEFNLQVPLPHRVIECVGRIVWIEQMPYNERYRAGLKLTENSANLESKEEIRRFLINQKK